MIDTQLKPPTESSDLAGLKPHDLWEVGDILFHRATGQICVLTQKTSTVIVKVSFGIKDDEAAHMPMMALCWLGGKTIAVLPTVKLVDFDLKSE